MKIRLLIGMVLVAGLVRGMVSAQGQATPFRLVGSEVVQPAGADEIGDVEVEADALALVMGNRLDLRYGQLVMAKDGPITLETSVGERIEIPAGHLAFAVQVGGDLSAVGPGWEIVLLMDSREGGIGTEALPQFTTDYEAFIQSGVVGLREFDGEAGFQEVSDATDVTGGLFSVMPVSDGREMALMADGAWVMLPFEVLEADHVRLRIETRRMVTIGDAADQWPDAGWFNYADGWTAETVNVLEGLDARVSCQITAVGVVNVRSLPSLNGMRVRQIQPGETATVVSQTIGRDGFIWWRLRDGNWVRSDVVRAEANCRDMPRIEP